MKRNYKIGIYMRFSKREQVAVQKKITDFIFVSKKFIKI